MKTIRTALLSCTAVLFVMGICTHVQAANFPGKLRGTIITSEESIDIPDQNVLKKLQSQDRNVISRDSEQKWNVNLVAFFDKPVPTKSMGIVVLDGQNEAVALATVQATKGQNTLACRISVESTEFPGKEHTLQVYYINHGKPVVLARKVILLK